MTYATGTVISLPYPDPHTQGAALANKHGCVVYIPGLYYKLYEDLAQGILPWHYDSYEGIAQDKIMENICFGLKLLWRLDLIDGRKVIDHTLSPLFHYRNLLSIFAAHPQGLAVSEIQIQWIAVLTTEDLAKFGFIPTQMPMSGFMNTLIQETFFLLGHQKLIVSPDGGDTFAPTEKLLFCVKS